jgi:hypothetical protein
MKRPENEKWLDEALSETIGSKETRTDFKQWKQDHPKAVEMLISRANQKASISSNPLTTRRIIMKSPVTKLAVAAVIIAVVLIGVSQFGGSATSVAWGEVIGRLEASRGLICRRIVTLSNRPGEEDYRMIYSCPTHTRTDQYEAGRITWSRYCDYNARTMVRIEHDNKRCFRHTISEREAQEHRDEINPKVWAQKFQSGECRKLGQKMIDGILCEGLETTDQTVIGESDPPVDRPILQLWVSVETGYPVLLEGNAVRAADNGVRIKVVLDQLQWDVELDPSEFEPKIPPDYELMD